MSARSLLLTTFGALIAALAAQALVAVLQAHEQTAMAAAEDRRHVSYRLADQLRQSSDELTRFARTYAVTGDERFKSYFQQVLAIRDGKLPRPEGYNGIYWDFVAARHAQDAPAERAVALLELMREQEFAPEELAKLEEAKRRSDTLVALENRAMDAMRGRIRATGGITVRGDPDEDLARSLLHGPEYHEAKAAIMEPIRDFFALVDARTRADVGRHRARSATLGRISVGIAIAAALLAAGALFGLGRRVAPVEAATDRLQAVAAQLDSASNEQQVGASQQSASVEETRQTFAGLLDAAGELTRVGGDVLQNAELAQQQAQAIAARIRELDTSTASITEILGMVKDIANKSEVLALNAALEGTKAGEAGRGFSLVATQMQKLAERVMSAVKRIETLTEEIQGTSRNAILAAEEAEKVATRTTGAAREIAEAVTVQQSGSQQVSVAMNEISSVAEKNVDAAREMVGAANDLGRLAADLQRVLRGRVRKASGGAS